LCVVGLAECLACGISGVRGGGVQFEIHRPAPDCKQRPLVFV
jgi:hypothetical protein